MPKQAAKKKAPGVRKANGGGAPVRKTRSNVNGKGKVRGRPPVQTEMWNSVLRLPIPLAKRLREAAKKNNVSINAAVSTLVDVWASSEGL